MEQVNKKMRRMIVKIGQRKKMRNGKCEYLVSINSFLQKIALTIIVQLYFLVWQIFYIIQKDSFFYIRLGLLSYILCRLLSIFKIKPKWNAFLTSCEIISNFAFAGYVIKNNIYYTSQLNLFLQGQSMGVFLFLDTSKFVVDVCVVFAGQSSLFLITEMYQIDDVFRSIFCTIQIIFLKYIYYRVQRQTFLNFLNEKSQHELIDEIIPTQLFVINYNPITQRMELVESNLRAREVNKISSDDQLDLFISSAQIHYTLNSKKRNQTLKQFLQEFFLKSDDKNIVKEDLSKIDSVINDMIAFQMNPSNNNIQSKYKVKILPRCQERQQVIVALEDLTQSEELKLIKQKARQADQHLQIFFEYFKQQIGKFFHAIDISCSIAIEDPQVSLMQAKRQTARLFNTVQNLAAFRKQDNQDGGAYNTTQFCNRRRLKSVNPNSITNFNFYSFMEEIKEIFPQLNNSMSCEGIKTQTTSLQQSLIQIFSDSDKIKCVFITLFSQLEESLPERIFKGIQVSYDIKKEIHYEAVQVNITLPVSIDWLRDKKNSISSSSCNKQTGKKTRDAYDHIKSLLNHYRQENVEIRDIEFAMIRFYLSQLSPYEMQIKEYEELDNQPIQRLSNSFLNINKENLQFTSRMCEVLDQEQTALDSNTCRNILIKNQYSHQQDASFSDIESCRRSIKAELKTDNESIKPMKRRHQEKKVSNFLKEAKNPYEQQHEGYKSITISISLFKDIRVILDENCLRSATIISNPNQNYLENPNQNYLDNPKYSDGKIQLTSNLLMSKLPSKYSMSNIISPIQQMQPLKKPMMSSPQRGKNSIYYPQSPMSVNNSGVYSPLFQKERSLTTNSVPEFLSKTLSKLNSMPQDSSKIQKVLNNLMFETKQLSQNATIMSHLYNPE